MIKMLRSTTVDLGKSQGRDTITKVVRATSKPGAIITARLDAATEIPLRSQRLESVKNLGTSRLFNKWEVELTDEQELEVVG